MTSKFKILTVLFGALLALNAIGIGVAQAARPVQPQWIANDGTIKSTLTLAYVSGEGRYWNEGMTVWLLCTGDFGIDLVSLDLIREDSKYGRNCRPALSKENAAKKLEVAEEISSCELNSPGASAGELIFEPTSSRLVWSEGSESEVLNLVKPAEGTTLFTFELTNAPGKTCVEKGTYEVKGEYLTLLPRVSAANAYAEAMEGAEISEAKNANSSIEPRFTKWEVEPLGGGARESGTVSQTVTKGESKSEMVVESTEQLERPVEKSLRGLFGVTE
jgi:hypothetical protein